MAEQQLSIEFSHTGTLNVMRLRVPADRITSVLSMGELGIDLNLHATNNSDLLELIRAAQAELVERGVESLVREATKTEVVA